MRSELRQSLSGFRKHSILFFFFFNFACDLSFLIKCEVSLLNVMVYGAGDWMGHDQWTHGHG